MFNQITDYQNLLLAYFLTRKCRRFKSESQKIEINYEVVLSQLQWKLKNNFYQPKPYRKFIVFEPKKRKVSAPNYQDRIVHHAIVNIIEPIFEKRFISHSYACRKYKGASAAKADIAAIYQDIYQKYGKFYVLKCDIKSYFGSINHQILQKLLQQSISCPQTSDLLRKIIDSYCESPQTGIPIGNLTSQLFANLYLHPLDIYLTRSIREQNYFRYMDDFIIFSPDKDYLLNLRQIIGGFLKYFLKLNLHPRKNNIFRADTGIDFVGYMFKPNSITLRKKTVRRHKRRHQRRLKLLQKLKKRNDTESIQKLQKKICSSGNSFRGFLKGTDYQENSTSFKINGLIMPKEI